MIFHVPFELDPKSAFANDIRPLRMLAAFRSIGYEVEVVHGKTLERKALAATVRKKIKSGVKYDFVYSECASLPTSLTDPSKKPTHPFFDLAFLRYCRRNDLKVGLFYRDVFWRFPNTGQFRSRFRQLVLAAFYLVDTAAYNFAVSKIYVPSMAMRRYIPLVSRIDASALPPGHDAHDPATDTTVAPGKPLSLLYVGGLGELYDLHVFMDVVRSMPEVQFTLCTRPSDWERESPSYGHPLNDNITVVHEQGDGLKKLYAGADVAVYFLRPTRYLEFAVPVKLFEYIGHRLPVIAARDTQVGRMVDSENVGWTLPFDEESLRDLLKKMCEDPGMIQDFGPRLVELGERSTWDSRARSVAHDLAG